MSITNPTYDNLAQTAHALAVYGIALTAARFGTVPFFWSLAYSSRTLPSKSSGLMSTTRRRKYPADGAAE